MKSPPAPRLDERRTPQFSAELEERARAWISGWGLADGERDFGRALLEIAARFNSEVAERLDDAGEKMRRGFLDWLAVQGEAARPARLPVVFKLADAAQEGVLASAPVRMQADAAGTPVVFETEKDVRIVPGRLEIVVGVDAAQDAFYLSPPGFSDLQPLEPLPTQWQLKSFASARSTKIQLDPETGLVVDMIIEAGKAQYRIVQVDNGIVTIEPGLDADLEVPATVHKVVSSVPFDDSARNRQEHTLYLGHMDLLNIESEAAIEVVGAASLITGVTWEYWGKVEGKEEVGWQQLALDVDRQKTVDDAVSLIKKARGAVEPYEIAGKSSRWIRAYAKTVDPTKSWFTSDELSIRVNAAGCKEKATCPPDQAGASPDADAMANSTPLVLDNVFSPLGKEPRQFDAFYLGCNEAFSKKGAKVRLCFELADPTFTSIAVVRGGKYANTVLAGVGKDGALHLLEFSPSALTLAPLLQRDALRPPLPADDDAASTQTIPINLNPACKPVVLVPPSSLDFTVTVASAGSIWQWHENVGNQKLSGWKEFQRISEISDQAARIDDIVPINGVIKGVLSSCKLWVLDGTQWKEQQPKETQGAQILPVKLVALAPVLVPSGVLVPGFEMVGISNDKRLYFVSTVGVCTRVSFNVGGTEEPIDAGTIANGEPCPSGVIRPVAYSEPSVRDVVGAVGLGRNKLLAWQKTSANLEAKSIALPAGDEVIGNGIEVVIVGGQPQFSVSCQTADGTTYVASWVPFDQNLTETLFQYKVQKSLGELNGAPAMLPTHITAPSSRGGLFFAKNFPLQRHVLTVRASEDGVVLPLTTPPYVIGDIASAVDATDNRIRRKIAASGIRHGTEVLHSVASPFGELPQDPQLLVFRRSGPPFQVAIVDASHIRRHSNDAETTTGDTLIIREGGSEHFYQVLELTISGTQAILELDHDLPHAAGSARYWTAEQSASARITPILRFNSPPPDPEGNWDVSLLDDAIFYFPKAVPAQQPAQAFQANGNQPQVIALQSHWQKQPIAQSKYILEATVHGWTHLLADTSSNPELSWEYSNGKAWQSLILEDEGTLHFKKTGVVGFKVPKDLAPTDWSGKTNHWIRARLIGGDYGKETVTVTATETINTKGEKVTTQVIDRSPQGIHPPSVMKLHISYSLCGDGIQPTFVLAQDSGTIRDQSDANRTEGALVEAFVPLALMLGRLSKGVTSTEAAQDYPPDCDCQKQPAQEGSNQAASAPSSTSESPLATGRALLIGLDAMLSDAPVNVLLLVDERKHAAFAPMTVEALVVDRFVPIVVDDTTRALGESGLLSMAFAIPPTRIELFGKTLTWLRLVPKSPNDKWAPNLRGAYLNAAWASATETLTRELLGSSNGEPHLTVRLARPPVLYKTLELRVKEPLGEEERKALLDNDSTSVLSSVDGLPGDWVRWEPVIDPDDKAATERVYALNESNGEIRFGDGQHGRIPPIGRDSIVAFRYCRTEPDPTGGDSVPANTIAVRTTLNLVSPVESVESVIAADQAAGGAPPESDDRVLRFGFARQRHRNRAVTAIDLEDLALQSSPDIVQARAFVRRGYIHLVVVMRGKNPRPNAAQVRELRRLLLEAAPASLSAPHALRIEGPKIRRLRIELTLRVETLDHTGELSAFVKRKLTDYFDTATGGTDKDGWPLGANPSEDDIAFAISDAPYLESIEDVQRREVTADGKELPSLETVGSREIVMLADDPIRIVFETAEVTV